MSPIMLKFTEWLNEQVTGNYVSIGSELPKFPFIEFKSGKTTPESDAHVTLMYSKGSNVDHKDILKAVQHLSVTTCAKITGMEIFGKENTTGCVVLTLDSPRLLEIHNKLKELGLQHSYDEFKPHLTLAYDVDQDECNRIKTKFDRLYGKETNFVILRNIKSEPIKENWSDKLCLND